MNGPVNSAGTGSFSSCLKAISDMEKTGGGASHKLQDIEFSDLIEQQNAVPELLEALKGLLPQQDFSQIEALLTDGNGLPPAAVPGSEFDLMPGESTLPIFATLAVANQQQAAAQIAEGVSAPLVRLANPETGAVPALVGGKIFTTDVRSELGMDVPKALPGSVEQSAPGFTSQFLGADSDSIARTRGSAMQDIAAAVAISPVSAFKAVEAAATRIGSPVMPALETPLAGKGWEQGLGERVIWMVGNSVQTVSLKISPAHLGPIDIKLSMQQDQASVSFHAQHAVVREVLEASIPRLREMFQENNLQLTHVDVGQRGSSGQQAAGEDARNGHHGAAGHVADQSGYESSDNQEQVVVHGVVDGLLNDYA